MMGNECDTDKRTKGTGRQVFKEQNVVITDHKHDYIFRNANYVVVLDFKNQSSYRMKVWP